MASSYSTNLRIELQGTGDHRSSWGAVANTGYTLLEEAISHLTTVNIADANLTLTAVNGATDQARPCFIIFTGTLTADRTVTIPNVSKFYFMRNTTIGGFNVVIANGGATIAIPPGGSPGVQWKVVFTDGADVYSNDYIVTPSNPAQRWSLVGYVDNTGVMEVGRYIDFHNSNVDGSNWAVRLETGGSASDLYIAPQGQAGGKVWTASNDGTGSGMDADLVDGLHATDIMFASGTSMLFWQSAAPTGWTKVTSQNDKALRVVSGTVTSGGSTSFSAVFTSARVPSGTVNGSALSEAQLPPHDHLVFGNSGYVSSDHSHNLNVNTAGRNTAHTHARSISGYNFVVLVGGGGGQGTSGGGFSNEANTNYDDRDHVHNVNGNTGGISANHYHQLNFNTQNAGSGQTHAHTFSGNGMNFDVAYVDMIIATKN